MAQDNTPAIVMYKGAQADGYSIPFDKGFYGEVKVAFVRRGLTDYEYNPTTYSVDGALYAWEISKGIYYYTKSASPAVEATVYNSGNHEISGVVVVSTQDASASFSDGNTGIRSNKKDIHSHALLFWTGEPLGDDDWICIVRETVKKQPYSYPNNQKHIEGALDNLSRQIQELKAQSDISLKVDPTFEQDPAKMNPIDWLNTIVRSTDTTARGLRYRNFWLEYSTDDPNKAESDKSWTKLLNTTNITSVREWYDEDNKVYIPQYSMDGGATWKGLATSAGTYTKEEIDDKFVVVDAALRGNADAIQKTREDFASADQNIRADMNAKDSELETILNDHAERLDTLRTDHDDLGDDVSDIQAKIPQSASGSNPLITKQQLLDEEMDIREDLNSGLSELQTQITAQAAEIAKKQDELIAGDNIVISGNTISATGAGGGAGLDMVVVDQLPATGRKGIIYLVKKDGAAPDIHDEYVWIESTQSFELIGTTQVDLSGYAKKTYVDSADLQLKANQDSLYANQVVLSGMLNTKDADGNWTALTTAAQAAIPAINELNEKIESAGGAALTNTAKSNLSLCIAGNDTTSGQPFSVWAGLNSGPENAYASNSLAVGYAAKAGSCGIALGAFSTAKNNGISIGYYSTAAYRAIQLGQGTNNDENTFKVGNANGNFEMMSADGTIPADRMSATAGTTGQVLTKTDTGMAWQEAQAGGTKITIIRYDE